MNENKVNAETASKTETNSAVVEAAKAAEVVAEVPNVDFVECESDDKEHTFWGMLSSETIAKAETIANKPSNPVRKGEIILSDECNGNLKDFKTALFEGKVFAPAGLVKTSYRVSGFVSRDGDSADKKVLCAKQFVVTLMIKGRWVELPRWLASREGGLFALSAIQTAKAAKELSTILYMLWVKGMKPETVKEIVKGWHKKPTAKK